jgi:hypothetical protein
VQCVWPCFRSHAYCVAPLLVVVLIPLVTRFSRAHRGLRHYWGLRVRGQHTKTTGRGARVMAGQPKKGK